MFAPSCVMHSQLSAGEEVILLLVCVCVSVVPCDFNSGTSQQTVLLTRQEALVDRLLLELRRSVQRQNLPRCLTIPPATELGCVEFVEASQPFATLRFFQTPLPVLPNNFISAGMWLPTEGVGAAWSSAVHGPFRVSCYKQATTTN